MMSIYGPADYHPGDKKDGEEDGQPERSEPHAQCDDDAHSYDERRYTPDPFLHGDRLPRHAFEWWA